MALLKYQLREDYKSAMKYTYDDTVLTYETWNTIIIALG